MQKLEEIYNKINNLNYLLDRKLDILFSILDITTKQKDIFGKNTDKDILDISMEEKQKLIDELISIDDMFINIFESFNGKLNENKIMFEQDILNIKEKIQKIVDLDFKIRLQEEKNKNIQQFNTKNINNNLQKVKTLKISKDEMLKKYTNNYKQK